MTQDTKPHAEGGSSILARYATGIDHVAIAVPDLETSIEFYSKVLGFELVERRRTEGTATAMVSAVMKVGPLTFVLIQGTSPQSQVSRFIEHYGPGVQHIAISVENIEEVASGLKESGMEFDTTIIRSPGLQQIFTHRDAGSGLMIEFIDRSGKGDFSDQSVQELFSQLEAKDSF